MNQAPIRRPYTYDLRMMRRSRCSILSSQRRRKQRLREGRGQCRRRVRRQRLQCTDLPSTTARPEKDPSPGISSNSARHTSALSMLRDPRRIVPLAAGSAVLAAHAAFIGCAEITRGCYRGLGQLNLDLAGVFRISATNAAAALDGASIVLLSPLAWSSSPCPKNASHVASLRDL